MSVIGVMAACNRGPSRRLRELASRLSAESRRVAVSATGARRRLRNHNATANEYCPSSSAVARHITPEHDGAAWGVRFCAGVRFPLTCRRRRHRMTVVIIQQIGS